MSIRWDIVPRSPVILPVPSANIAALTFSIVLGVLLVQHLVSDGSREHMAGDVPSRNWKGQYGKREKYKGCD